MSKTGDPISRINHILVTSFLILGLSWTASASPEEWAGQAESQAISAWNFFVEDPDPGSAGNPASPTSLACIPYVNVSLGQGGFAVITPLMLVPDPDYPPFQYTVDIMGPLTNTVYCEQLGQELMVVVTEIPTGNSCMSTIHVEDKLRPLFSCTPDTLPCNTDIATIPFENFVEVQDNCDPDPELWYSYVIQSLPCNGNGFTAQVLVTWTATDASGNSSTCQDIIYLKKPAIGQIVFPPDVSVSCTNPDIDPAVTGSPSYNGLPIDYACQYTVWYNDVTIPMCPGAHKIKRTWTVMDWCTSAMRTDVQEILIIDDNAPTITCPPSITISTNNNSCSAKYTLPVVQVSDLCANPQDIVVRFHVAGIPGIFSSGQMVTLGVGITVITVSATDPCGNSSICQYNVTVRDNVPPIPICHNLVVSLGPDGMAFIYANLLDFPITENCGILSKQIWRMTNNCGVPEDLQPGPDVKFCCADVGTNVMVAFKVTDVSGNMNTCMFQVTVQDKIPPVAHCKDITISVQGGGTIIVDPSQINNGSTDNCSIVDLDLTPNTFDCEDAGVNVVVLTVTDQSGNTSTCSATVTIVDDVPPNALCHDITVTIGGNGTVTIQADDIDDGSFDNCGIDTMWLNQYTFTCDDEGPNLVTLTVEDFAGNTDACTATVTVLTSPPVALCKDATVSLGADGTVTINGNTVNNGSFDDCGQVTLMVTPNTFDCTDLGPNLVTLTVTDNSGNTSTCTAIVTIVDDLPPIALCHDITVMLDDNGNATITAAQIDNGSSDNCDSIMLSVTPSTFDCEDVGNNVVTLTVTDQAGNTSTCTANVMVAMPDPPNAICQNADVTLNQNGTITIDPQIVNNGSNTQCGDLTFSVDPNTFDCGDLGPNIVVLTVTDEAGSSSTCTAIVTVHENPPVAHCKNITVSLGPNGMVTINASQVNDNSTDDCPPFTLMVTPSTFDCTDLGPNVVTLTVTDGSGNTSTCTSTVTVQDDTPPVPHCHDITVTLNSNGMITITGAQIDNGSTDNCSIISLNVNPDTFDCQDVGPNLVVLTVTDQSGNTATCSAIVTVNPPPPMATCQDITVSIGPNGSVTIQPEDVGSGGDPCDDLTLTLDEDTFDCFELGPNIVTLTVTDGAGNTSTCTSTVTVVDDDAPICHTQDITVALDGTGHATINANQINNNSTDNCMISMISVTPTSFDCGDVGPNIVTLTVTDQSGNSSTCTATVTVVDNTPPICHAMDITVTLGGNGMVTIQASQVDDGSTDNCPPPSLSVNPDTFDCNDIGDNLVVLTVTDASGNTSTCTAIVTVNDSGGLQANCQNVTIFLDANGNAHVDPSQVNNGSGGGCNSGQLTFTLTQTDFNCFDLGQNIVTLTVTDQAGNTATCTAIITVTDNIPPQITCPANLSAECHTVTNPDNTSQFGNATGSDNCPGVVVTETHVLNLNSCGIGTISRTFTATDDSGNTATCTQLVTIFNADPFDEGDITWPASPVNVNICNSTEPQNIPNGVPIINPNALQCANIVINHTDVTQVFIDNNPNTPCKIITRTWTVTDLCQNSATFTFVQTINVQDMVPPLFTQINDMTKVANSNCVAFFTLIASATDCAGVTITNNSPYGVNNGSNASGNYPIGVTTVIFTATDGCGNISTMDVVLTVIDNNPPDFMCNKVVFFLPPETEISIAAHQFVTIIAGDCSGPGDFIISYSHTNPFDTLHVYDCGDVGVQTFPLYFWNANGTMIVDSCNTADLEIRDPNDYCMDGLLLTGDVKSEDGWPITDVQVDIMNVAMTPDTTDIKGAYFIDGLNENTAYTVAPHSDRNPREGVSTLDLVLIQKHLLGRAKLNSPYKIIAADANRSGLVTALDLLDIRKLILGITNKFTNNTSWRFVDKTYEFPDPYNPFKPGFPESVSVDSVTQGVDTVNFTGIKVGDVNGSYFTTKVAGKLEPRSSDTYEMNYQVAEDQASRQQKWELRSSAGQSLLEGFQFSLVVGPYSPDQVKEICSDVIPADQWIYDPATMSINVSWTPTEAVDLTDKLILCGPVNEWTNGGLMLDPGFIPAEAYSSENEGELVHAIQLKAIGLVDDTDNKEYHLFQNIPNPFSDGTLIRFMLPKEEDVQFVIHDITGRLILERKIKGNMGMNEVPVRNSELKAPGIYYYTLQSINASMTRKMSFTNN